MPGYRNTMHLPRKLYTISIIHVARFFGRHAHVLPQRNESMSQDSTVYILFLGTSAKGGEITGSKSLKLSVQWLTVTNLCQGPLGYFSHCNLCQGPFDHFVYYKSEDQAHNDSRDKRNPGSHRNTLRDREETTSDNVSKPRLNIKSLPRAFLISGNTKSVVGEET